jgi:hypothetical protein
MEGGSVAELGQRVTTLSLDELLALSEAVGESETLGGKLAPLAHKITVVACDITPGGVRDACVAMQGKILDRSMLEKLVAQCMAWADGSNILECAITRQPALEGMKVVARVIKPGTGAADEWGGYSRYVGDGLTSCLYTSVHASDIRANAVWPVEPPAKEAKARTEPANNDVDALLDDTLDELDAELDDRMGDDRDEFWTAIDELCAGKGNVCGQAGVQLIKVAGQ